MKHCHFSILYNELPFLKQKLPFLYDNFDQVIFYDLNVCTSQPHFSTDGCHEFIKDFPDPENKIILIEQRDITQVNDYRGGGSIEKQKMFAVGSQYVRDDIDVFWCTDLDEFFHKSFIDRVEETFKGDPTINSIDLEHYLFWKNFDYILCSLEKDTRPMFSRVCRHKKGNIYGHCSIHEQFPKNVFLDDHKYYHFSWFGDDRVKSKFHHYSTPPTGSPANKEMYEKYLTKIWNSFNPSLVNNLKPNEIYNYPHMHPNSALSMGIKKYRGDLPDYINCEEMLKDFKI